MLAPSLISLLFPYTTLFRSLLAKIETMLPILKRRAFEFKGTPQIGRTHGIHAEPTSFGLVWALWYSEMRRNRERLERDRKSTRLNSSHVSISYAVFCLKKKK